MYMSRPKYRSVYRSWTFAVSLCSYVLIGVEYKNIRKLHKAQTWIYILGYLLLRSSSMGDNTMCHTIQC